MRRAFAFIAPILLCVGGLFAPPGIAAEKSEFTATDLFNPLPLPGFPAPQIGELLAPPVIKCPGYEPTGDPSQPCPVGSRTHSRDGLVVSRLISDDPRVTGWLTVELNSNLDAYLEGPSWGKFRLDLDGGQGVWEGTWTGYRVAEDGYWVGTINGRAQGYGGIVDGMKMMAEEQIILVTPMPIAYIGTWTGRIIDPR